MEINLKDNNLFNTDILAIEKNECIIFGNNGTGKSTLVREIKNSQKDNYDVRIFQGFDSSNSLVSYLSLPEIRCRFVFSRLLILLSPAFYTTTILSAFSHVINMLATLIS